jgi:hypothetical protein
MMMPDETIDLLMDRLAKLKDDWDSYGGKAPTKEAMEAVRRCLSNISVYPMGDGGIQIDLDDGAIVITPEGKVDEQ